MTRRVIGQRLIGLFAIVLVATLALTLTAVSARQATPPTVTPTPPTFNKATPILPTPTPVNVIVTTPSATPTSTPARIVANPWTEVLPDGAPNTPSRRSRLGYAWDPIGNRLIVFGGRLSKVSGISQRANDVWVYTPLTGANGWAQIPPNPSSPPPSPRESTVTVWDTVNSRLYVFGGTAGSGTDVILGELWQYAPGPNTWQLLNPAPDPTAGLPPARTMATGVWDEANNRMLVFGGLAQDRVTPLNDLWAFHPGAAGVAFPRWERLSAGGAGAPPARKDPSSVWDSQLNRFLVFGGTGVAGPLNDVWAWSQPPAAAGQPQPAGSWTVVFSPTTQPNAVAPQPRAGAGAAWDPVRNRMVVFGGYANRQVFDDVWAFSGSAWTEISPMGLPSAPSQRANTAWVWATAIGQFVLFGGDQTPEESTSVNLNDTWFFFDQPVSATPVASPTFTPTPVNAWWLFQPNAIQSDGSLYLDVYYPIQVGQVITATPQPVAEAVAGVTALPRTGGPVPVWLFLLGGCAVGAGYLTRRSRRK